MLVGLVSTALLLATGYFGFRTASLRIEPEKLAEKRGAHWEITLSKPCGVEYPAKTPVRAHFGGWYQYLLCAVKASTLGDWKSYTFKISGTKEGNPCRQWTLGTAGIKFIIFNNGKEKGKDGMFFRNLTVTTPEQ